MSTDTTANPFSGLTQVNRTNPLPVKSKIDGALSQAQFLKLMTAQMTHQDPSKPMDNGEFLTQMAQFGTVSGIQDLQKSFSDFASSVNSGQAMQASGLVGQSVLVPTTQGELETGQALSGKVTLTDSTPNLSIKITDKETGETVKTLELGQQAAGAIPFSWDGLKEDGSLASPGAYKIEASASIDGNNTILETLIKSKVESVNLGGTAGGIKINLLGNPDSVDFKQIKEIL